MKWVQGQVQSSHWGTSRELLLAPLVPNCPGSKSISDASESAFPQGLESVGQVFDFTTIAVPPDHPSQNCSKGGKLLKKWLSTRTHKCLICGFVLDKDGNAALKRLK
ncbi:MAG: zinc ribbon domain-containing protein [Chroococcales cyanobacterium]